MGSEDGTCPAPSGEGDWRGCLQALQDPCGQEIYRPRVHRDAPEAEGELEKILQGQEVQAPGLAPKEDQSYPQGPVCSREVFEDRQAAACSQVIPPKGSTLLKLNFVL